MASLSAIVLLTALVFVLVECEGEKATSDSFEEYQAKYGKEYVGASPDRVRKNYERNVQAIKQHNSQKNKTYEQGENDMTGMSREEAIKKRCGFNGTAADEQKKEENQGGNFTMTDSKTGKSKRVTREQIGYNKSKHARRVKGPCTDSLEFKSQMPPIKQQGSCGKRK